MMRWAWRIGTGMVEEDRVQVSQNRWISLAVLLCFAMLSALLRADEDAGVPNPAHLQDQGIHYLRMGRRDLARGLLEKALRLGGADDERLILTLSKLYHEEGEIVRAFEVLAEGPATDKVRQFRSQLSSLYAKVRLVRVPGGKSSGPISLLPEVPIIQPEKKAFLEKVLKTRLSEEVRLPLDLLLPTGRYRINGRPLEPSPEGSCNVEVPFYEVFLLVAEPYIAKGSQTAQRLQRELGARVRLVDFSYAASAADGITDAAIREPDLLIALGFDAARRAYKDLREIQLLGIGLQRALGSRLVKKHGKATAVWKDLPRRQLFEKILELIPTVRRIGVVYERSRSWDVYQDALDDCPSQAQIVGREISSPDQIVGNLLKIRPYIDALWIMPDPVLFDTRAVELISSWSYREGLPVLVEQISMVKHGAMLAAEVPWETMMSTGIVLARKVLWDDKEPQSMEPRRIRSPSWGLNLAVCDHLRAKVPEPFLDELAARSREIPKQPRGSK